MTFVYLVLLFGYGYFKRSSPSTEALRHGNSLYLPFSIFPLDIVCRNCFLFFFLNFIYFFLNFFFIFILFISTKALWFQKCKTELACMLLKYLSFPLVGFTLFFFLLLFFPFSRQPDSFSVLFIMEFPGVTNVKLVIQSFAVFCLVCTCVTGAGVYINLFM